MITRQTTQRKSHRYWPFYRYAECWWQHPYCHPPCLRWMGKPGAEEEEEELKDFSNLLDQFVHFAIKIREN